MDLYALRIFCQVMEDKTFSLAAKSLGLSQPTISQQVAKLEARLKQKLFERVGRELVPTKLAKECFQFGSSIIEQVNSFEAALVEKQSAPKGIVRIAKSESAQWTPYFMAVMGQISTMPEIRFEISILPNDQILEGLLRNDFDFGFIVGEKLTPDLRFEKFSDEIYSLVGTREELFKGLSDKTGDIRLVTYPGWESFFETWAKTSGLWNSLKQRLKTPAVKIGTLGGAIRAIRRGAGVGVVPFHCVEQEIQKGELREYITKKGIVASSPVYLARRRGEELPKRAEVVLEMLRVAKKNLESRAILRSGC